MDSLDYLMKCSGPESAGPEQLWACRLVLRAGGEVRLAGIEFLTLWRRWPEFVAGPYGSMVDMVRPGRHPITPSFAMRGDLVFPAEIRLGCGGGLLGICNGSTAIFLCVLGSGFHIAPHALRDACVEGSTNDEDVFLRKMPRSGSASSTGILLWPTVAVADRHRR